MRLTGLPHLPPRWLLLLPLLLLLLLLLLLRLLLLLLPLLVLPLPLQLLLQLPLQLLQLLQLHLLHLRRPLPGYQDLRFYNCPAPHLSEGIPMNRQACWLVDPKANIGDPEDSHPRNHDGGTGLLPREGRERSASLPLSGPSLSGGSTGSVPPPS